ncbi:MAG TPA: thioesterase domain-containing protein [Gemmatimonadales bacterium]|nr:thioesterase domain-containing protein [Gemmatimonadales bacterium]
MNALALLSELRSRDIHLRDDGDRLKCDAPVGALTPELLRALKRERDEILNFLRATRTAASRLRAIVPIQPRGSAPPIFGVPGHNGDVFCFLALARHLGDDQPFYGLQPPGLDGKSGPLHRIEELAAYFEGQIRAFHPRGPFVIAGHCAGCVTAFELGRRLHEAGMELDSVALFSAPFAGRYRLLPWIMDEHVPWIQEQVRRVGGHLKAFATRSPARWGEYLRSKVSLVRTQREARRLKAPDPALALRDALERATIAAAGRYRPRRFWGRLMLFVSSPAALATRDDPLHWRDFAADSEVWYGPSGCQRDTMLREPHAKAFAHLYRSARGSAEAPLEAVAGD